jgi:hypothetical protein
LCGLCMAQCDRGRYSPEAGSTSCTNVSVCLVQAEGWAWMVSPGCHAPVSTMSPVQVISTLSPHCKHEVQGPLRLPLQSLLWHRVRGASGCGMRPSNRGCAACASVLRVQAADAYLSMSGRSARGASIKPTPGPRRASILWVPHQTVVRLLSQCAASVDLHWCFMSHCWGSSTVMLARGPECDEGFAWRICRLFECGVPHLTVFVLQCPAGKYSSSSSSGRTYPGRCYWVRASVEGAMRRGLCGRD